MTSKQTYNLFEVKVIRKFLNGKIMDRTFTILLANVLFIFGSLILLWSIWRWIQRRNYKK